MDRDLIRVLDLLFLKKDEDGSVEAFEASDLDDSEIGELRSYEKELAMLLSEQDVADLMETIEPGSSAAVLVWENLWAAPFGAAVRHAGGQLVATGRIPIQAIIAAMESRRRGRSLTWRLQPGAWSAPAWSGRRPSYARRVRWRRSPSSPTASTAGQDRRDDRRTAEVIPG